MTEEELKSVLVPGAKLESFIIDEERVKHLIEETHKRQEEILKQKYFTLADLQDIITI